MAFTIVLQNNTSPKNVIGKTLTGVLSLVGDVKEDCDISNPTIVIQSATMPDFNYFTIDIFKRSYYKTALVNIAADLWEISGRVDVLESFKNYLGAQKAILSDTSEAGANAYILNDVYMTTVKTKTDIMVFPSGLLDDGEFILVTAGGLAV